jgi:hypothetical protein
MPGLGNYEVFENDERGHGTAINGIVRALLATGTTKNNLSASSAPTATDDTTEGYEPGSLWVDLSADAAYVCVDATEDAAVWVQCGGASGPLDNYSATQPPSVHDDEIDGYGVGSMWIDVTQDPPTVYICRDPTEGDADWMEIGTGGGTGDMLKSVYDTDDDGIVDAAEGLDDGTYAATAQDVAGHGRSVCDQINHSRALLRGRKIRVR